MGDRSKIEWTNASWNPVTGCDEVSPGCDHCYAKTFAERWRGTPGHHFERGFDLVLRPERLDQPLRWSRPRMVFVNSMSDLFHAKVPDEFIARVFATMAVARRHTFQLLTKRHGRMRSLLNSDAFVAQVLTLAAEIRLTAKPIGPMDTDTWPLPNLWLGVSVENQTWADIRVPALLATPAAVRWLSCEPLLGPVDLNRIARVESSFGWSAVAALGHGRPSNAVAIDWVVAGGESGSGARPMHPDWARTLRDQCLLADVPFFFKQWGAWTPDLSHNWGEGNGRRLRYERRFIRPDGLAAAPGEAGLAMDRVPKNAAGRVLDGRTHDDFPTTAAPAALRGQATR
jgi:protein gp37